MAPTGVTPRFRMFLNDRASRLTDRLVAEVPTLTVSHFEGARIVDASTAGLSGGLALARVCLADLAEVTLVPGEFGPLVQVATDWPVAACLASQYAGWQIQIDKYFAMGSGAMRAAYGKEPLFDTIGHRETPTRAVGVLETRKPPTAAVIEYLADKLHLPAERLDLWFAPTASIAGSLQVVARSVETALHKLHELKFDVNTIAHAHGTAPLPTAAKDDLEALGRTNDAILYAGKVHLWLKVEDDLIASVGPQVPACASPDFGTPFGELFAKAGHDFYKLDPHLFAPAEIVFHNMASGRTFAFGRPALDVLRRSFGLAGS